ncbi:MAG: hypothetical protein Q9198_008295, partial [Flavoplaca austrocitrina]
TLSFNDVIKRYLGTIFSVTCEEMRISALGYPKKVAQRQSADSRTDAFGDELFFDVASVFSRADFAIVENEFDRESSRLETDGLEGWWYEGAIMHFRGNSWQ